MFREHFGGKTKNGLIFCLFFVLTMTIYHRVFSLFFVQDDFVWLSKALAIQTHWPLMFQTDVSGFFMPIVSGYFTLMHHFFGTIPWPYYLANAFLHSLNGFLFFLLLTKLTKESRAGFLGAILFLSFRFPMEAVVWISAVTELLSMTLLLSAGLAWSHYLETKKLLPYFLCLGSSLLLIFTKEWSCLLIPFLLWITCWVILQKKTTHALKTLRPLLSALIPFFLIFTGYFSFEFFLQTKRSPLLAGGFYAPGWHLFPNILNNFLLTIFPFTAQVSAHSTLFATISLIFLLSLACFCLYHRRSEYAVRILLALGWIMIAFIPTAFFTWDPYISRYGYIPSFGTALLLTTIFYHIRDKLPSSLGKVVMGLLGIYILLNSVYIDRVIKQYYLPLHQESKLFSLALQKERIFFQTHKVDLRPGPPYQPAVLSSVFMIEAGTPKNQVMTVNAHEACPVESICLTWDAPSGLFRTDSGEALHGTNDDKVEASPLDVVLTEKDFDGFSVSNPLYRHSDENTFHINIHPSEPIYTFHIVSTSSNGYIDVFAGQSTTATQRIRLDPNRWLIDESATFFNVADINFDGYADIGVVVDGGALWGAYEYWVFDPHSRMFVSTPFTKEFRTISFDEIRFDKQHEQIITHNLLGAVGASESVYQFHRNHLFLEREYRQENTDMSSDGRGPEDKPVIHCLITIRHRVGAVVKTSKKELAEECGPIPQTY